MSDPKDLIRYSKQLEVDNRKLSQELTEARDRLLLAEKGREGDSLMAKELTEARIRAGLVAMKGPGTIITLSDSQRRPGPAEDPYSFIVHDVDLLALVNELWAAGAEAVSVNDQRIVNRTAIRCVGPAILVNNIQLASPFVVRSIGKGADLEGGMRMPGGFLDSMGLLIRSGGEVRVTQADKVTVPAFEGPMTYRFAVPANGQSPTSQRPPARGTGVISHFLTDLHRISLGGGQPDQGPVGIRASRPDGRCAANARTAERSEQVCLLPVEQRNNASTKQSWMQRPFHTKGERQQALARTSRLAKA
jgi:uncharacterized protein YlxW (UPF0749 family)